MNGKIFSSFAANAIVAVAALSSVAVLAQATDAQATGAEAADAQTDSEIVVEAPRPMPVATPPEPETNDRSPFSGAPIVISTVRIPVFYSDLDLNDPADAERLMSRIDRIAQDACKYMDRLYPLSSDAECVSKSVTNAKAAAKEVIAAAGQ